MTLFDQPAEYDAFERVLADAMAACPIRLLGYCVMPTHWHLLLWPRQAGELTTFMQRLTVTHVRRWLVQRQQVGMGSIYQGRFKSFPVASDEHLLAVLRYVERNPRRAKLVRRAEAWRWSSLWRRTSGSAEQQELLTALPVSLPEGWVQQVNAPETSAELARLRLSVNRGRPFGAVGWTERTAKRLGLPVVLRGRGRPRKHPANDEQ